METLQEQEERRRNAFWEGFILGGIIGALVGVLLAVTVGYPVNVEQVIDRVASNNPGILISALEASDKYYVIPLEGKPSDDRKEFAANWLKEQGYLVYRDRIDAEIELGLAPGTLVNPVLRRYREAERLAQQLKEAERIKRLLGQ